MPTTVTISSVTGASPYDIWICDTGLTTCVYVLSTSTIPLSFNVPLIFSELESFVVKIIDNNGCVKINTVNV